jgi:hypothetical protein
MRPESVVLLPPTVIGLLRDPKAATDALDLLSLRKPVFSLSQHADDLFRVESLSCHPDLLPLSRFVNTNSKPGLV